MMSVHRAWIRYTAGGLLTLSGAALAPLPVLAEPDNPNPVVSETVKGTGGATPYAAGAAALLVTQRSPEEVKALLQRQFPSPGVTNEADMTEPAGDQKDSLSVDEEKVLAAFNEGVDGSLVATEEDLAEYFARYAEVAMKYPVTTAVNEYAARKEMDARFRVNPEVLDGIQTGLKIGAGGAIAGVAAETVVALTTAAKALALAEKALAAKNVALSLGTQVQKLTVAAQAAAKAGNLQQAAALSGQAKAVGAQAQAVGSQAKATGAKAMKLGKHAKNAAEVGKILAIVGGSLAVIDGGFDLYRGITGLANVDELEGVARDALEEARQQEGISSEDAENDFASVMQELDRLKSESKEKVGLGSTKIGCGGLMIGSAFMSGPLAPVVAGGVAAGCLIGTTIYEYREPIANFFKKLFAPDPSDVSTGAGEAPPTGEDRSKETQAP